MSAPRCYCGRFMSRLHYFDGIANRYVRWCRRCLHGRTG